MIILYQISLKSQIRFEILGKELKLNLHPSHSHLPSDLHQNQGIL